MRPYDWRCSCIAYAAPGLSVVPNKPCGDDRNGVRVASRLRGAIGSDPRGAHSGCYTLTLEIPN